MKYWIMCLLRINSRLDVMSEKLEKERMRKATCVTGDTLSQIKEICELNDRKVLLINLRVCYDYIMSVLVPDEKYLVDSYARGCTLEEIAVEMDCCKTTVLRRLSKAITKAERTLKAKGLDEKFFEEEYKDFLPIKNLMKNIKTHQLMRIEAAKLTGKRKKEEEKIKKVSSEENNDLQEIKKEFNNICSENTIRTKYFHVI